LLAMPFQHTERNCNSSAIFWAFTRLAASRHVVATTL
jgi:hypothetical protein